MFIIIAVALSAVFVLAAYVYDNSLEDATKPVPEASADTTSEVISVPDVSHLSLDQLLVRRASLVKYMSSPGDESCVKVERAHMFNINNRINALVLPGLGHDGRVHFSDEHIRKSYARLM